jgi:nitrile hydratase accessory protein
MTEPSSRKPGAIPELEGVAAHPRKNGEPIFDAPWQSRAFGMVASLYEQDIFAWEEFKQRLIDHIAADEAPDRQTDDGAGRYYEHWMSAFYDLVIDKQLLAPWEIEERESEFRTGKRREVF